MFRAYFVHFLRLGGLIFICLAISYDHDELVFANSMALTSGDLFCTHTFSW